MPSLRTVALSTSSRRLPFCDTTTFTSSVNAAPNRQYLGENTLGDSIRVTAVMNLFIRIRRSPRSFWLFFPWDLSLHSNLEGQIRLCLDVSGHLVVFREMLHGPFFQLFTFSISYVNTDVAQLRHDGQGVKNVFLIKIRFQTVIAMTFSYI